VAATVENAIADLKTQFEKAVSLLQRPGTARESVHVEQTARGQWSFWVHTSRFVECRLESPRSLWLEKRRISTKGPDICLMGARYSGENLIVLVEAKHSTSEHTGAPEADWISFVAKDAEPFTDPVRNVAAKRSWRVLHRILESAKADRVEDVASQSSDLAVVVRALEQPEAIDTLKQEDPFAAARLRGIRERERLLSEEGGTWNAEQVAKHLHVTRQTVNLRRKQGALLGVDAGRHGFRYPAWQFARTGTIKGLEETLGALRHLDPWMQQTFMLGTNARLNEQRPIDVLRAGDTRLVLKAASMFGEHGAA
jgi:hypothetical protein